MDKLVGDLLLLGVPPEITGEASTDTTARGTEAAEAKAETKAEAKADTEAKAKAAADAVVGGGSSSRSVVDFSGSRSASAKFWVVCAYFNPCRYENRLRNYQIFARHLRRQNVPLCTVELAFSESMLQLKHNPLATADGFNKYISIISPDVLWAKECLLNIGIRALPPACVAVCWADADLVWDSNDWAERTLQLLTEGGSGGLRVLQPFARCTNMLKGETFEDYVGRDVSTIPTALPFGKHYAQHPTSYIYYHDPYKIHAGFAWAIRRDVYNQMGGLYEHCILGQADYVMALAFSHSNARDKPINDSWNQNATFSWSEGLQQHARTWQKRAAAAVDGRLGYLPNVAVFHNEHGDPHDRQYYSRGRLLGDYAPSSDVAKNDQGMLCFTPAARAKGLPVRIHTYFQKRKEDGRDKP